MKINFYISMKDGTFIKSEGILLPGDIVAHKVEGVDWRLTDYRSGMLIKSGFSKSSDCKRAWSEMPKMFIQSIEEIRQSDKYKAHCEKLFKYVKEKGV